MTIGECGTSRADRSLTLWIFFALVAVVRTFLAAYVPILPKEAMFFQWARHGLTSDAPAPTLVWGIVVGTELLGATALGVRLLPVLAGLVAILLAYRAGWCWTGSRRSARMAAILTAVVPLLAGLSILAVPASLVVVCYLIGLEGLGRIVRHRRATGWYLLALGLAGAIWCTPTAVVMLPLLAVGVLGDPARRWWRSGHPYAAVAALAAATTPWWWWEVHHGWRLSRLAWGWRPHTHAIPILNLLEFAGEQVVALSPTFIVAAVLAFRRRAGQTQPYRRLWLALAAVPFLAAAGLSVHMQTHPEWPVLAYPPLVLAVAAYGATRPAVKRWVTATVALTVGVAVLVPLISPVSAWLMGHMEDHPRVQQKLARIVFFRGGYPQIARTLEAHYGRFLEPRPFVFGQQGQITAPLSFYWPAGPYVYNFQPWLRSDLWTGRCAALWEDHAALVGRDGLYVGDYFGSDTRRGLERLFDRVDSPEEFVLRAGQVLAHGETGGASLGLESAPKAASPAPVREPLRGVPVMRYYAVHCHGFKGPPETNDLD